jgi:hypothetical protein
MNCTYCDSPLPKSARKGGRKREFCNDACKNKHYRWHKQVKHDVGMLEEPKWKSEHDKKQLALLQFASKTRDEIQKRDEMLKEGEKENEGLRESKDYWHKLYDELRDDYKARMKAQGFSEAQIEEFNEFWYKAQGTGPIYTERVYESDDKKKIRELEERIDSLQQLYKKKVDALRNKAAWQAKGMASVEAENSRLKDLLDEKSRREAELENVLLSYGLYHALPSKSIESHRTNKAIR